MGQHPVIGIIVIFIGVAIILNMIGLASLLMGPLILLAIAIFLFRRKHLIFGVLFALFGVTALTQHLFHVNIGSLAVSLLFIYLGIRLLTGRGPFRRDKKNKRKKVNLEKQPLNMEFEDKNDGSGDDDVQELKEDAEQQERPQKANNHSKTIGSTVRSAFIGDYHLMGRQFELEDLSIRNGIGDVKIDLTKAIIPEGETVISVQAFIGDVDIYVPYDLELCVTASVTIGDLEILSEKQGGFGRQVTIKTKEFDTSKRRVKLNLSLFVGDIDVRVL